MSEYVFDRDTRMVDGDGQIVDGWDIGGNANGGYLMALGARGMREIAGRPDPISVTGHYLSPGRPGPVRLDGAVVKSGRRFATVAGQLHRDGAPILQLVGTFGDLSQPLGTYEHLTSGPPELPPYEECLPRESNQGTVPVTLMDKLAVRLHPEHTGFARGEPSGVAEIAGWFGFADGRPVDTLALLLICDVFPPAVFHLDMPPGWVPTVEYTVHVRGVPAPGPLRCVFRSHYVQGGFLNEDGEVWDSDGKLVAQSRQLGLTPLG